MLDIENKMMIETIRFFFTSMELLMELNYNFKDVKKIG
jgi:hypothetical protein